MVGVVPENDDTSDATRDARYRRDRVRLCAFSDQEVSMPIGGESYLGLYYEGTSHTIAHTMI